VQNLFFLCLGCNNKGQNRASVCVLQRAQHEQEVNGEPGTVERETASQSGRRGDARA
jgi:hypothetical protein